LKKDQSEHIWAIAPESTRKLDEFEDAEESLDVWTSSSVWIVRIARGGDLDQ